MQPLGMLIRPTGRRLPILRMRVDGTIEVQGVYVTFETTIPTVIKSGYELADATIDLQEAWKAALARIFPHQGVNDAH